MQPCLPAFSSLDSEGTAAGGQQLSRDGPEWAKTPLLQHYAAFWLKSSMLVTLANLLARLLARENRDASASVTLCSSLAPPYTVSAQPSPRGAITFPPPLHQP